MLGDTAPGTAARLPQDSGGLLRFLAMCLEAGTMVERQARLATDLA